MRRPIALTFLGLLVACGGSVADPSPEPTSTSTTPPATDNEALVGSWTYAGHVPDIITVTLTFGTDKSVTMVETVAPPTTPAGLGPSTCVTTDTYLGTYAVTASAVDLTFTGGTENAIVGCDDAAPGLPMTPDGIAGYREQGLVPAASNTYAVTATTLVLTPTPSNPAYIGMENIATAFTKVD